MRPVRVWTRLPPGCTFTLRPGGAHFLLRPKDSHAPPHARDPDGHCDRCGRGHQRFRCPDIPSGPRQGRLGSGQPAAGTIPSGIPRSCGADVTTLLPGSTRIGWLALSDGDDFVIDHGVNNSLGFTPKAMAIVDDEEVSDTRWRVRGYAVKTTGELYYFSQSYTWSEARQRTSVVVSKKVVARGWKDTRALAGAWSSGRRVLYRLHGSALGRYDLTATATLTNSTSVARTGWYSTRTISMHATNAWADQLAATRSSGELMNHRISKKVPATGSANHILTKTGFGNFKALSTGHCAGTGRVFLGVRTTGGAAAFYDRDKTDNSANLVGGYVTGSNWPYRVYST